MRLLKAFGVATAAFEQIAKLVVNYYATRKPAAMPKQGGGKLCQTMTDIINNQQPLGAEFEKVLDDNLSELLVRDWGNKQPPVKAGGE